MRGVGVKASGGGIKITDLISDRRRNRREGRREENPPLCPQPQRSDSSFATAGVRTVEPSISKQMLSQKTMALTGKGGDYGKGGALVYCQTEMAVSCRPSRRFMFSVFTIDKFDGRMHFAALSAVS